ncbi:anthrone oxygenase family protein [Marimonas lutisalis]|uniref:anthrone oxygenase family protein n=1 Tax=Marimonas lutisalis TaxID=2545756 RepID=UPI0010F97A21|nr:anthrone oxygenase family protein [Marimonas lutisalis]
MPRAATSATTLLLYPLAGLSLLLSGAIFGFFYAWVCSTMWGLDAADPRIAIPAMQAMNASVRNIVFAPAFFGTPFVLLLTAAVAHAAGRSRPALLLAAAGLLYLVGGMILTIGVNVPMNQALAQLATPESHAAAAEIWAGYSPRWQVFNVIRTLVSGLVLLLSGWAILLLGRNAPLTPA